VLVEKQEDPVQKVLTRRIITLRQIEGLYRRTDEVHHQRLFDRDILSEALNQKGFQVVVSDRYGAFRGSLCKRIYWIWGNVSFTPLKFSVK
jgi:hypothetical protein